MTFHLEVMTLAEWDVTDSHTDTKCPENINYLLMKTEAVEYT